MAQEVQREEKELKPERELEVRELGYKPDCLLYRQDHLRRTKSPHHRDLQAVAEALVLVLAPLPIQLVERQAWLPSPWTLVRQAACGASLLASSSFLDELVPLVP